MEYFKTSAFYSYYFETYRNDCNMLLDYFRDCGKIVTS